MADETFSILIHFSVFSSRKIRLRQEHCNNHEEIMYLIWKDCKLFGISTMEFKTDETPSMHKWMNYLTCGKTSKLKRTKALPRYVWRSQTLHRNVSPIEQNSRCNLKIIDANTKITNKWKITRFVIVLPFVTY